jgi:hypothetical protein
MSDASVEFREYLRWAPNLMAGNPKKTSNCTKRYNCLAWAAGCALKRWDTWGKAYWPTNIPRDWNLDTITRLFQSLGYQLCKSDGLEDEWEKVALYAVGDECRHIARQKPDGKWTSKLGNLLDLDHDTLECLCSVSIDDDSYGRVARIMRRPRKLKK